MTISEGRFLPLWNIKKSNIRKERSQLSWGGGGGGGGERRTSKFDSLT